MEQESMPYIILTVVIAMIILAVGTFAFFITTSEIGYTQRQTQTFNVTNPSVANTFTLRYYPEYVETVQQYNGVGWYTVTATHWELNMNQVTVQASGMQG